MKSGVNRFVRENYKRQLQKAKQNFDAQLQSYKRASRRLLASKFSEAKNLKPDFQEDASSCNILERPLFNLTRSIFSSVSNWTSNNSVVKNLVSLSSRLPKISALES